MTGYGPTVAGLVISLVIVAAGVVIGVICARDAERVKHTLAFGVPAEAFVLVIYKERRSVGTSTSVTRHSILAFRTPDGREYRIDEQNGLRRAVGDRVGVRYLPERPDRAVTVDHGTLEDTICVAVGALLILGGLVGVIITLGHLPPRPPIVIPQWRH